MKLCYLKTPLLLFWINTFLSVFLPGYLTLFSHSICSLFISEFGQEAFVRPHRPPGIFTWPVINLGWRSAELVWSDTWILTSCLGPLPSSNSLLSPYPGLWDLIFILLPDLRILNSFILWAIDRAAFNLHIAKDPLYPLTGDSQIQKCTSPHSLLYHL